MFAENNLVGLQSSVPRFAVIPSLARYLLQGSFGFGIASLCVFATVAFAEGWMYDHLGVSGAYLVWTVLFIAGGGAALKSLVFDPARKTKFYAIFGAGFFMYAVGWVAAYFILRGRMGEWFGSLAGSLSLSVVIVAGFKAWHAALASFGALFISNSIGYFLGSILNESFQGKTGMLLWGAVYGLFLGAGLGLVLYLVQYWRVHAVASERKPPYLG